MTMKRCALLMALSLVGSGVVLAQQAGVNLVYNPQANTENLAPYGADVISPEVHDDRRVTFRLNAPDAREVLLSSGQIRRALDSAEEPLSFTKDEDGLWTLTVGPIEPDIYTYKLSVDGVSVADPNNTFAGISVQPPQSLLVVHGDGPAYYDARDVPHGAVTRNIYHSDVLDGEREMYVYTPPGYDPSREYPVLYLVGGSGESASNWSLMGRANFIMDNLLAEGAVVPMVIAMPNNQVVHRRLPNHVEFTFDLFEKDLVGHIIPFVEANYSVQADRHGRALAGLSMGGRHTQFVGFKRLDLFASFGVLSAGSVDSETDSAEFLNDPDINEKVDYLFVGQGTHEASPGNRTEALHLALENHNIEHEYYVGGNGAHDWSTWRHLLHEKFLPGLWRADRD